MNVTSRRPLTSRRKVFEIIEGKVIDLHQELFQVVTFEDYSVSEVCPTGIVTTSGWQERRAGLLRSIELNMFGMTNAIYRDLLITTPSMDRLPPVARHKRSL